MTTMVTLNFARSIHAPLTDDQIQYAAPSVFASEPWDQVGAKYKFISTAAVLAKLRAEGFQPYQAQQSRTRTAGKADYVKHLLRLRPVGAVTQIQPGVHQFISDGQVFPEIILTNGHDGGTGYCVEIGFFRLICLNGAVASAGKVGRVYTAHVGDQVGKVIDATYRVVEEFPAMIETVKALQAQTLSADRQYEFAQRALGLRWKPEEAPFDATKLLAARRPQDAGNDAFRVFNRVQENLIKGGLAYRKEIHGRVAYNRTRGVHSVDSDLTINRGLWALASELVSA